MAFTSIDDILIDNQAVDKADLREYLKNGEIANVKNFGAVGDGETDDTGAFLAAIDSLPAFAETFSSPHAGMIFVPRGYYKITAPIELYSGCTLFGELGSAILNHTEGGVAITSYNNTTQTNFHIAVRNLTIKDVFATPRSPGSIGVDMCNVSYAILEQLRIRNFETGVWAGSVEGDAVAGGFYNQFYDLEIANSVYGIYSEAEWNTAKVVGGRIHSNFVGLKLKSSSDALISTAFERNNLGVEVEQATGNSIVQCRFESNSRGAGSTGDIDFSTGGAIYFHPTAERNLVVGGHFSSNSDRIVDFGRDNQKVGPLNGGGTPGQGLNYFCNPSMDIDSNTDGVADGFSWTNTAGITPSIDTSNFLSGTGSQKIAVDNTNSTRRDMFTIMRVVPGMMNTVTIKYKATGASIWNLRVGLTSTGSQFANVPFYQADRAEDGWMDLSVSFYADPAVLSGQEYVYVTFFMNTAVVGTNSTLWIDSLDFCEGLRGLYPGAKRNLSPDIYPSGARPDMRQGSIGTIAFDTGLGKLIVWNGTAWVDAVGTAL